MSTSTQKKIDTLLREHRFTLVRQSKHKIFQAPSGHIFVTSTSPSDWRAAERSLSVLKRILSNPPEPMSLAISAYEREQAALLIAGEQKLMHSAAGMGSGKQRKSTGTGYKYTEKILTAEDIAHNEFLRQQAVANAERKKQKRQRRRQDKLDRRLAAEQERLEAEAEYERTFRPFLNQCELLFNEYRLYFINHCQGAAEHRYWQADTTFYEFDGADKDALHVFRITFDDMRKDGIDLTVEALDEYFKFATQRFTQYAARIDSRVEQVKRFIEKQLKQDPSLLVLGGEVLKKFETVRIEPESWDLLRAYGYFAHLLHRWLTETKDRAEEHFDIVASGDELIFYDEVEDGVIEVDRVNFVTNAPEDTAAA
jgi:hypothetical protein